MNIAISNATHAPVVTTSSTQCAPAQSEKAAEAPPAEAQTKVSISNAAKAALQEATETHAQTVKEAQANDPQAQRLLAKEAAAKQAVASK